MKAGRFVHTLVGVTRRRNLKKKKFPTIKPQVFTFFYSYSSDIIVKMNTPWYILYGFSYKSIYHIVFVLVLATFWTNRVRSWRHDAKSDAGTPIHMRHFWETLWHRFTWEFRRKYHGVFISLRLYRNSMDKNVKTFVLMVVTFFFFFLNIIIESFLWKCVWICCTHFRNTLYTYWKKWTNKVWSSITHIRVTVQHCHL